MYMAFVAPDADFDSMRPTFGPDHEAFCRALTGFHVFGPTFSAAGRALCFSR